MGLVPLSGTPVAARRIPRFVGPWSLLGVSLGTLAWLAPLLVDGVGRGWFVLPTFGVALLAVPGPPRQLASGLLASALVWPFTLIGAGLVATVLSPFFA